MHVRSMESLPHLEIFHEILSRVSKNFKDHIFSGAVICVAGDHFLFHEGIQILLIILCPAPRWKFSHLKTRTGVYPNSLGDPQTRIVLEDLALETPEPRF